MSFFVRTRGDKITDTLYKWAGEIINGPYSKYIGKKREGDEATRENIENDFNESYDSFIFYGHGYDEAIFGYENEEIINCSNVGLVNTNLFFSVACESARKLGKIFTSGKTDKTFFGFKDKIKVPEYTSEKSDFLDELYSLPINLGVQQVLQGNKDVTKIKEMVIDKYDKCIKFMEEHNYQDHVVSLKINMNAFVVIEAL